MAFGQSIKTTRGKTASITLTQAGEELLPVIEAAWKRLYERYSDILGEQNGIDLTRHLDAVSKKL